MIIRAVICDIYRTVLAVSPPPADASARWRSLWQTTFNAHFRLSLEEFAAATKRVIAREHETARAGGQSNPEVSWPDIVLEIVPELEAMPPDSRAEFLFRHAQLMHTVGLMPGAGDALRLLSANSVLLGIASNSQPYTLRELDIALAAVGLTRQIFTPSLCFFSFAHGYSKPNPQAFRLLTARLAGHGISQNQTLMVGNDPAADIAPAQAEGWNTWQLTEQGSVPKQEGNWRQLACWFEEMIR